MINISAKELNEEMEKVRSLYPQLHPTDVFYEAVMAFNPKPGDTIFGFPIGCAKFDRERAKND